MTVDFDSFINQARDDHATDPEGVARRLQTEALGLVSAPGQVAPLAQLTHHVFGEHLGRWEEGLLLLKQLAGLPASAGEGEAAIDRFRASLRLSAGDAAALDCLAASERVRVLALAAANLAGRDTRRDTGRATPLFEQALAQWQSSGLSDADPCVRSLAVTANNLAAALEEKPARSGAETALMLLAAQTARRCWALAGTWLETERADYRLSMSWLQAGDAEAACRHAQACLDQVASHQGPALEAFFGNEALARAESAAGRPRQAAAALAAARQAYAALAEADRSWCLPTLQAIEALAPAQG